MRAFKFLTYFVLALSSLTALEVDKADYTGSRNSWRGVTSTSNWLSKPGFQVEWDITYNPVTSPGMPFHYIYSISGVEGRPLGEDIKKFYLETSTAAILGDFSFISPISDIGDPNSHSLDPGDLFGIRFNNVDAVSLTIDFWTNIIPE